MIEVDNLYYNYPGNALDTIKGLSFSVGKGEIFGFLGPSGAGKSTTQNILIGLLKGYKGSVKVLDEEIKDINNSYYEKIGVAFEFPNFYTKFTALENLNLFKSLYKGNTENPEELLDLLHLSKDANKRVGDYSKGMKMRLNLCRAMLNKPQVLFLDEPTSGLDPVNSKKVKDIILNLKGEGKTILLTTHNMNVAEEICDRVAFIVDGNIPLIDEPRRLKINYGKKRIMVEFIEDQKVKGMDFELKGIGENVEFNTLLKTKEVERVYTEEATLEEIFIKVTGRSLL